MTLKRSIVAVLVLSLSACGGHKSATTTTQNNAGVTPAPVASMGAMQSQREMAGEGSPAPAPSMDCGGTQPVWVNERSHVFHLAGDPYYGRTKHGKYMCERDAARAGYHPSRK
jgi:hypothetical protein